MKVTAHGLLLCLLPALLGCVTAPPGDPRGDPDYPNSGISLRELRSLTTSIAAAFSEDTHVLGIEIRKGKRAVVHVSQVRPSVSGPDSDYRFPQTAHFEFSKGAWRTVGMPQADHGTSGWSGFTIGELAILATSLKSAMWLNLDDGSRMSVAFPDQGGILAVRVEKPGDVEIVTGTRGGNVAGTGSCYHFHKTEDGWKLALPPGSWWSRHYPVRVHTESTANNGVHDSLGPPASAS